MSCLRCFNTKNSAIKILAPFDNLQLTKRLPLRAEPCFRTLFIVRQRAVKRTKIVNLRKFSLIGTLSLLITACATLQPPKLNSPFDGNYDPITTYLSAFIEKEMRQGDLTGLSIAMVKGDRIVWSEGFGLADKKKSLKATAQTRYRAGSVSKCGKTIHHP